MSEIEAGFCVFELIIERRSNYRAFFYILYFNHLILLVNLILGVKSISWLARRPRAASHEMDIGTISWLAGSVT